MGNFGEIFRDLSNTRASARELDMTLNVFGFSREKQWESVKNTGSEESMLDFALAWISFQAKEAEGTRYDGRNALSCQLAGKLQSICDMQELRQQVSEAREDVDRLVKQLFDLHRTLKQRLTGFCFFVLEQLSDRFYAVNDAINQVCSEPFTFFAETGFDEHTTKFERSDWYRMPFI